MAAESPDVRMHFEADLQLNPDKASELAVRWRQLVHELGGVSVDVQYEFKNDESELAQQDQIEPEPQASPISVEAAATSATSEPPFPVRIAKSELLNDIVDYRRTRAINYLEIRGIRTVGDLWLAGRRLIGDTPGVGNKAVAKIEDRLSRIGTGELRWEGETVSGAAVAQHYVGLAQVPSLVLGRAYYQKGLSIQEILDMGIKNIEARLIYALSQAAKLRLVSVPGMCSTRACDIFQSAQEFAADFILARQAIQT